MHGKGLMKTCIQSTVQEFLNLHQFFSLLLKSCTTRNTIVLEFRFLSTDGKRTTVPYGIFRLRTCAMDTIGAVAGPLLRDPASEDQMDRIFTECNRPMFFRIWDTSNNYTLYKFENVGPIDKD